VAISFSRKTLLHGINFYYRIKKRRRKWKGCPMTLYMAELVSIKINSTGVYKHTVKYAISAYRICELF
jgi:hypothetical protein